MAQNSFPFENADTTETQYSQLFSELQDTGVAGDTFDNAGIAVSLGTGMELLVSAGFAMVRGFAYENTATVTLTADAADTTNPRIDTVILRLDPGANSIVAAIKKGTPGASPSAPALTQIAGAIWEMPLANITIPANATALDVANLSDRRAFLGGRVGLWRTVSRPANPDHGSFGFNITTGKFEWYDSNTNVWSSSIPIDISGAGLADGSVSDSKLVTRPGFYVSVRSEPSAFTVNVTDAGRLVRYVGSNPITVQLDGSGWSIGQRVDFIQDGTGQITFAGAFGSTVASVDNKLKTNKQYSAVTVVYIATATFRLIGDLVA